MITWLLDVPTQNAWHIHKMQDFNMKQVNFKAEIAMSYLNKFQIQLKAIGRKLSSLSGQSDMRYDGVTHYIEPIPQ